MERLLEELRSDPGKRHLRLRRNDGQEAIGFHAIGRNGNWPVVMTRETAAADGTSVLHICSTLPLTLDKGRRSAVAELVTRLNELVEQGRFEPPDVAGRGHYRAAHRLPYADEAHGVRSTVERHVATVDSNLPSFFAVAAGGQTPTEAVDQLERMWRFG